MLQLGRLRCSGFAMPRAVGASALAPVATCSDTWIQTALVVALGLRLFRLDAASLWFDEVYTARWIALPWGGMLRQVLSDNHMPLYFVLLKAWSGIAGFSPSALRLPSAVASWATVPLTAAVAATLADRTAARWAAWLSALSPYLLHHAQDARMYALVAALAAVHLLQLSRYLTERTPALRAGFVMTSVGLVCTHYYTLFLLIGELLVMAVYGRRPLRSWVPAAAGTGVIVAAALCMAAVLPRHSAGGTYEIGWLTFPGLVWALVSGYVLVPSSEALHARGLSAALPYVPLAVAVLPALVACAARGIRALGAHARVLVVLLLMATLLGPFVAQLVVDVGVNPRYAAASAPLLIVMLAAGAPRQLSLSARSAAIGALGLTMIVGCALHLRNPGHGRADVRAAGAWLDAHVGVNEEIVVTSNEMLTLARFHWPARPARLYPDAKVVANAATAGALADRFPFPGPDRAIYVIGRAWVSDPSEDLQGALRRRYASCGGTKVAGIRILCLRRPQVEPDSASQTDRSTSRG